MQLDLERQDILNLLAALNAMQVSGKDAHIAVLKLMQKLEAALQQPPPSGPE